MKYFQFYKKLYFGAFYGVFLLILSSSLSQVTSAELIPIDDQITKCKYRLTGVINRLDSDKIKKHFALKIGYSNPDDWKVDFTPGFNDALSNSRAANRFSIKNTQRICLDSPGGSFLEALNIAKIIHALNWGTIVPKNATCESACALIFLAGSFFTEGESVVADRHIHATAKLGFHAPSLLLPESTDQLFDREVVMKAYKVAIQSMAVIQQGVELLNLRSSLLAQMLITSPDEMFYIDTIEKAQRWHIGVYGTQIPSSIGGYQMQLACDAAIESLFDDQKLYQSTDTSEPISDDYDRRGELSFKRKGNTGSYNYNGVRTGYLGEAVSECKFSYSVEQGADVLSPGYMPGSVEFSDENLQVDIGPHFLFSPKSKLAMYARVDDRRYEAISFEDTSTSTLSTNAKSGMCRVITGRRIVDAEECIQTLERNAVVHTWPSGSRTVIASLNGRLTVNGSRAQLLQDGSSGKNKHLGRCYLNRRTQNIFCFYDYAFD